MKTNKYEIDMCNGSIMDKLISFALPLMLSGILQLMFNAVDIIVVGHFTGKQALAAVGSTTALINVFTNLFIGISLGANVLAARFFASGREKEMSDTVHTAILLALISGILMAGIGVISAKGALLLMGTPDNVIAQSTLYMRIYFLGMPFFMLYNYGAAILRAVGDTKRPLLFLKTDHKNQIQAAVVVSGDFRMCQCAAGSDSCDRFSSGCGRRSYCDDYGTDDLLHSGFVMPVPHRQLLSAAFFEAENKKGLSAADFSGGNSCRDSKYGY